MGLHDIEQSRAELLSDTAVYRRTARGQRELLKLEDNRANAISRVLARVNGYTDLRRLVDLAPDEATAIGRSILELVERGLIERVEE